MLISAMMPWLIRSLTLVVATPGLPGSIAVIRSTGWPLMPPCALVYFTQTFWIRMPSIAARPGPAGADEADLERRTTGGGRSAGGRRAGSGRRAR